MFKVYITMYVASTLICDVYSRNFASQQQPNPLTH